MATYLKISYWKILRKEPNKEYEANSETPFGRPE